MRKGKFGFVERELVVCIVVWRRTETVGIGVERGGIVVERVDILVERVGILVAVEAEVEAGRTEEMRRTDLWARVVGMGIQVAAIRKDSVIAGWRPQVIEVMLILCVKAETSVKLRVETPSADHWTDLIETRETAIAIARPGEASSALAVYSQQVALYQTNSSDSAAGKS